MELVLLRELSKVEFGSHWERETHMLLGLDGIWLSLVQSLSCVRLFTTSWTAVHQASLSITNSWSSPKPMSIESVEVHVLLKPGLENFEHYFTSVRDECNCAVVWAFFGIAFLWDWNENWPFPTLWPLLSFPNLLAYLVQHFHSIIFQDLK